MKAITNNLNFGKYYIKELTPGEGYNLDKNVTILKGSILPNKDNSIIFLAAHSGNSKVSFFNKLDKIKNNQEINFYYNNYKYIYKVIKKYETNKDGDIEVNKDFKNKLILTTCSIHNKKKQLIVESIMIKKKNILGYFFF